MKTLIILAVSFFLLASTKCQVISDPPPVFPEHIKNFYVMDIADDPIANDPEFRAAVINPNQLPDFYNYDIQLSCLKFEIVSKHPFKLKYLNVTEFGDCRAVGGYQPRDHKDFYNFVDDSQSWMKNIEEQRKKK